MKAILELKKNNFVFNYLAYSFEKGLKYYIIKWNRVIKKLSLQDFYLNQDDDEDVVDIVEEKKKLEHLKSTSLIVKRFRNIAYKKLRSNFSLLKDNFDKWNSSSIRLKIIALKQKKMLKILENTTDIQNGKEINQKTVK